VLAWLRTDTPFPPIESALRDPNGLLAASPDLSAIRLLDAYRRGIFPWYTEGQPVLWWSPDPRMVLPVEEFRLSRSLRRVVSRQRFDVRVDTAFRAVIERCADTPRAGQAGTWITPDVVAAYSALYTNGFAHSVEAWRDGQMVGGLYGVAIGRMFFGESMFAQESDASKVALVQLVAMLRFKGFPLIDCQQETDHLASFGARPMPRREFAERLSALVHSPAPGGGWAPVPTSELLG
jgi:leucyl/phenylalanyl-tRNA---protein transferase